MGTVIIAILETVVISLIGLLVKRYVFLEPDMETKKQRIFYGIGFLVIVGVFIVFGKNCASAVAVTLIGVNICLARERHRLMGLLLMISFSWALSTDC